MRSSKAIASEVAQLEERYAHLKERLEADSAAFSALQAQLEELRDRLSQDAKSVKLQELRLEEKNVELAAVQRRERLASHAEAIAEFRAAQVGVSRSAEAFVAAVAAYDDAVAGLTRLRESEGVVQVERALEDESTALSDTWESVSNATAARLAADVVNGRNGEPVAARIRKYLP